jgi:hypothetical protein
LLQRRRHNVRSTKDRWIRWYPTRWQSVKHERSEPVVFPIGFRKSFRYTASIGCRQTGILSINTQC